MLSKTYVSRREVAVCVVKERVEQYRQVESTACEQVCTASSRVLTRCVWGFALDVDYCLTVPVDMPFLKPQCQLPAGYRGGFDLVVPMYRRHNRNPLDGDGA
jgi:hypothetical protein